MTGETEKGSSISVVSMRFPAKSHFAMAQAAATPPNVFTGTEIAATSSVRRMAARESGSLIALQAGSQPRRSASASTAASGSRKITTASATASSTSATRAGAGSRVAALIAAPAAAGAATG